VKNSQQQVQSLCFHHLTKRMRKVLKSQFLTQYKHSTFWFITRSSFSSLQSFTRLTLAGLPSFTLSAPFTLYSFFTKVTNLIFLLFLKEILFQNISASINKGDIFFIIFECTSYGFL